MKREHWTKVESTIELSVAEVDALVEHIKTWRKEYGYPEV